MSEAETSSDYEEGEDESTCKEKTNIQEKDIYMNASEIEIGFLEVVGNAMVVDLKKYHEDAEKLFNGL
ncbi:2072_t:CDS:2 [Paraglomus brasilianum]|uniref:2072_t:CDS:1 n=1 Tax=Paraglomus brasilianum TaxID=144538 RepID=A0A9N8ZTT1_9GLOM|nr:2072_t:CDS:2 [Paraglomus brasilianum]